MKKNEGEAPQYYVENNHKAIIDATTFDLVQAEILKRARRTDIVVLDFLHQYIMWRMWQLV